MNEGPQYFMLVQLVRMETSANIYEEAIYIPSTLVMFLVIFRGNTVSGL